MTMTSPENDRIVELFEALAGLDAAARLRALDAAGLEPARRAELEALLDADRSHDTRLDRALSGAALRLRELDAALTAAGAQIGSWRIERELGAGGMGTVFLARRADAGDEQRGALKLLRGFPTEEGRRRLRQERRVLAALEHPYIARLIDGGETADGQPYLVMEYVEGATVTAFAARRSLDAAGRVALVDRIAEAVAHAHQRLVIHRDLKPSNVLVRDDGMPRVLDFGVAKLIDAAGDTGGTSTRVWTPGYASPEQEAGGAVTTATDVYALGVLLGELLSGRRPDGKACDPALAPVVADADLRGIVAKASAEDAGARYATVEALRDDLARWRDGRPVRAARDSALYRARKFVRRHRGSVSLVLLVLVALAAFVWRLGVERNRALEAEALAEQRRIAAEQAADTARGTLDFFAGVLAELSPETTGSRSIRVDDWLDRAGARLARELPADAPEASLYGGYLGALHGSLGDTAKAIGRLEPALARLEAQALHGSALYAGLASTLAGQLFNAGRTQDAAAWSRRAAAAWRQQAESGHAKAPLLAAMADGYAHYVLGELEPAVVAYRAALALPQSGAGDAAVRDLRAESANVVGASLNTLGRSEEALAALDEALAALGTAGGAATAIAARLHRSRSEVLSALGRGADALAAIDAALAINDAIYGPRGRLRVILLNTRGTVLNDLARYAESRDAYAAALAGARDAGAADDPAIRLNLANACDSVGDYTCARDGMRRLLDDPAARAAFLPQQLRQLKQMLGRALSSAGERAAARRMLDEALAEIRASEGAASPNGAATLITAAENEQRDGRWAAALDHARRAREAYAAIVPPGHFVFATLDRIEGRVALGEGRLADAARLIEAYHDATVASDGADSLWAAFAGLHLASLRHAQGHDDEARALLRRHLPKVRETVLPSHVDRAMGEALAEKLGGIPMPGPVAG
jgi:serine/threonine-protein kinase